MREVFKGWRRKVGCVAMVLLVVAALAIVANVKGQIVNKEYKERMREIERNKLPDPQISDSVDENSHSYD